MCKVQVSSGKFWSPRRAPFFRRRSRKLKQLWGVSVDLLSTSSYLVIWCTGISGIVVSSSKYVNFSLILAHSSQRNRQLQGK